MPYPNPADLDAIRKDPNVQVLEQPGLNVGYLAYNVTKKPFDDVRVRKAINMAINKQAIIDAVYLKSGVAAKIRSRRRSGPTTTRSRMILTIRPPRRSSWPTPAIRTASPPICGQCPCSARTTPTRSASPS
jgi:ABC-type transport system substrate-binding protein